MIGSVKSKSCSDDAEARRHRIRFFAARVVHRHRSASYKAFFFFLKIKIRIKSKAERDQRV